MALNFPHLFSITYGSQIYGTATEDSDTDVLVVVENFSDVLYNVNVFDYEYDDNLNVIGVNFTDGKIDAHCILIGRFFEMAKNHDIRILEAFSKPEICFNPLTPLLKDYISAFPWDSHLIRETISSICSNSWVKCKKKLTISKDYNPYIAKKSLWNVLRLYMFGIQIGKHGKIIDFTEANKYYDDIVNYSQTKDLWACP